MIYLSEVRKSPEGLAFNEAPLLLESIKERYRCRFSELG